MRYRIEQMTKDYRDDIMQLVGHAYEIRFWEPWKVFLAAMKSCPDGCWVALCEEEPVGYMLSYPSDLGNPPALNSTHYTPSREDCLHIHDIAVREDHRRKRVAQRLVEKAQALAERKGILWMAGIAIQKTREKWALAGFEIPSGLGLELEERLAEYGSDAAYMVRRTFPALNDA